MSNGAPNAKGKSNSRTRRAKHKRRQRRAQQRTRHQARAEHRRQQQSAHGGAGDSDEWQIHALIDHAVASCQVSWAHAPGRPRPELVELLVDGPPTARGEMGGGQALVDDALGRALLAAVTQAWRLHWQPADIPRMLARTHGPHHARLASQAVVQETRHYQPHELPPRWRSQIDALDPGTPLRLDEPHGWVVPPCHTPEERIAAIVIALQTLATLRTLPRLAKVGPLPGEHQPRRRRQGAPSSHVDPSVLHRVTSLLAKAESTTFPDEAEALTAKAQELMARNAIDAALLASKGDSPTAGAASARRLGVEDPYAPAKATLLQEIAEANRCRSVWSKRFGFATVFGREIDLDAVELLYTSLLVQSARMMIAASPPGTSHDAGRTRSFRQSFLVSFAARIGQRLHAAVASAVAGTDADRQVDLLPVLAGHQEAADAACREAFPSTTTFSTAANDLAGWQAGRDAADRAQLDVHDAVAPPTQPSIRRDGIHRDGSAACYKTHR